MSSKSELFKAFFEAIERPSLILKEKGVRRGKCPIGASRIGGIPDLPADFEWPYYDAPATDYSEAHEHAPLAFVAQIDCAAAYEALGEGSPLPQSGMLWFFYEMESQCWGFDLSDEGCSRVIYADVSADQLTPTRPPKELAEEYCFMPYLLSFQKERSLPDYEEADNYPGFCDEMADWDDYDEAALEYLGIEEDDEDDFMSVNRLCGYADLIQGDMLTECELTVTGRYDGHDYPEMTDEEKKSLRKAAAEWQLLLQVASSEEDDARMFGDCGNLYFYIKKDDLAARRFDKVWLVLQCG